MLTYKEKLLVEKLAECYNEFCEIANDTGLTSEDKREFCDDIHHLQYRVMAQIARREYPGVFR